MTKLIKKLVKYALDSNYRFMVNDAHLFYKILPDDVYLKKKFQKSFGYPINLERPQTFNEKLQWLKIYDRKPIYTTMVDKYAVKDYVASIMGEEHIIPTLGVWDRFDDIDFDSLPNQFVLKCTHDSGGLVICKDKSTLDKGAAKKKLNRSLRTNYYDRFREWPYKDVKPRIIAEKYMEDSLTSELRDYKFFCFNGVPKIILVCRDRFSELGLTEDFFDQDWNHLDVQRVQHPNSSERMERPEELDEMLELARILSKDIPFLRSDFYIIGGKVFFGELTFFPASGFEKFVPESFDKEMGDWITLPTNREWTTENLQKEQ